MKSFVFAILFSSWAFAALASTGATESRVSFVETPEQAFAARWDLISNEKEEILADFNMWESNGASGTTLAKLCLKAREGVRVRLVIDGFSANFWGVGGIDASLIKVVSDQCRFEDREMFTIRYWNPVDIKHVYDYLRRRSLKRDHDKILFAKSQGIVYTGDRNWQNVNYRQSPDDDKKNYTYISIDAIARGAIVDDVRKYLEDVWTHAAGVSPVLKGISKKSGRHRLHFDEYTSERLNEVQIEFQKRLDELTSGGEPQALLTARAMGVVTRLNENLTDEEANLDWHALKSIETNVRFVHFAPGPRLENTETAADLSFTDELVGLVRGARRQIVIATPYLRLPDRLREAILAKQKEGIEIRVITSKADSKILPKKFQFQNLDVDRLRNGGVQIFQKNSSDDLHAKLIVIDGRRAFIGSNNLNMRAAYMDLEAGLLFDDERVAAVLLDFAERDLVVYKRKNTNALTWIVERIVGLSGLLKKQL